MLFCLLHQPGEQGFQGFLRCRWGVRSTGASCAGSGSESRAVNSGTVSDSGKAYAAKVSSSLRSLASGVSSRAKARLRSQCVITGRKALCWVWVAAALDARRRGTEDLLPQHLDEAGFTNARFPSQEDDLPHAVLTQLSVRGASHLLLSPHQRCQASRGCDVEPCSLHLACKTRYTERGWSSPLRSCAPRAWQVQKSLYQSRGRLADKLASGAASPWSRAAILGVSPSANCLSVTTTDPTYHDQARMNTYPYSQAEPFVSFQASIQCAHHPNNI